ncbi:kinase-like domain-containing protein [Lophiotrema nucula]|uniref:Kinase-like domain-containing protein n=1 Tax=Lophiotrema nucula TaxID=690887 RepID=A0A6A5ZL69_9PLEO|nr:kinase-like domain-containing protein [Lophiotrema nucula]
MSSPVSAKKQQSPLDQPPEPQIKTFLDRYKSIKLIGSGGSGDVFLCKDLLKRGTTVAVKVFRVCPDRVPHEVAITKTLGAHENLVKYFEYCNHPSNPRKGMLVMERCQGDLEQWKNKYKGDVPEAFLWRVFKQMSAALAHLHSCGIIHGDFKHQNVLYLEQPGKKWPTLKPADFGTSVVNPDPEPPRGHYATFGWTPPEAEERFGPEFDIWGLGCLIHWLALSCIPVRRINVGVDNPDGDQQAQHWFYHEAHKFIPEHTYCLTRIDVKNDHAKVVRSKLLNHFMMRALDMKYYHRISSHELNRFMEVIEPFVQDLRHRNLEGELDRFNDGHDQDWKELENISDSRVILQIFERIRKLSDDLAKPLLKIMDGKDFAIAHRILGRPMLRGPQIVPGQVGEEMRRGWSIARKPLPRQEQQLRT